MGGICNNQQVPRNPRAGVKDMLLSLAIILVPVMLIVWFFTRTPDEPNIQQVDWKPVVASARSRRFGGRPRPAMPTRGIAG